MKRDAAEQSTTSWKCILLILATIAVTCLPVLAFDYGYADDFWVISMRPLNAGNLVENVRGLIGGEGRCLFPIWALGVMGQVDGVQGLKYVRLTTLVAVFFSAVVFYKLLRRHLVRDRLNAALIASIFSINPAFLIISGWAEIGSDCYACLLGLLAGHFLLRDPRFNAAPSQAGIAPASAPVANPGWRYTSLSALFLFLALCLYQPGAMIFWTAAAIWIIGRFTSTREDWLKLVRILALFACVLVVYFLFSSMIADPNSKFHVSISVIRRVGWFILYPLKNSLCYPLIQSCDPWSIAALLILSLGLWQYCRQTSRTMWIPPLVLMLSPVTVLPTIVAYGHYDVSRTRPALYGLIILVWYTTFEALVNYMRNYFTLRQILIPSLVLLSLSGAYHLQRYFIMPQLWEEGALLVKLQEYVRENPKLDRLIVLWAPPASPPITEFQGTDEMGFASLSRHGSLPGTPYEVRQILAGITHRQYEDVANFKVITNYTEEPPVPVSETPPPDAFVIDFRQLRAPR